MSNRTKHRYQVKKYVERALKGFSKVIQYKLEINDSTDDEYTDYLVVLSNRHNKNDRAIVIRGYDTYTEVHFDEEAIELPYRLLLAKLFVDDFIHSF